MRFGVLRLFYNILLSRDYSSSTQIEQKQRCGSDAIRRGHAIGRRRGHKLVMQSDNLYYIIQYCSATVQYRYRTRLCTTVYLRIIQVRYRTVPGTVLQYGILMVDVDGCCCCFPFFLFNHHVSCTTCTGTSPRHSRSHGPTALRSLPAWRPPGPPPRFP